MKKLLLLLFVPVFAATGFAATTYNNFTGYSDFWHPFGFPDTSTYGESFTAPTNGDNLLTSFGFYMGTPITAGDIFLSGYIATWTGTTAGAVLYSSPPFDYDNLGNEFVGFNNVNLPLTPGGSYIAFLSISQYYGGSAGQANVAPGNATIPGGGFAFYNNGGNFGALTGTTWDATGLTPDWAVDLEFTAGTVPEPAAMSLLGIGLFAMLVFFRRQSKLRKA